jgi:hypothetical protein
MVQKVYTFPQTTSPGGRVLIRFLLLHQGSGIRGGEQKNNGKCQGDLLKDLKYIKAFYPETFL